jgi:hypothetical protein
LIAKAIGKIAAQESTPLGRGGGGGASQIITTMYKVLTLMGYRPHVHSSW